jgi:ribonuclease P protein component
MPTFCKEERLCNKRHIFLLQREAQVFFQYPFTVKWMEVPSIEDSSVRILTAVPKRNFKKAVDRNAVKRLIKEAFRLNKEIVLNSTVQHNKNIIIMLLYSGKKIVAFKEVETKIVLILQQIADSL